MLIAALLGCALALQSRANGALGSELNNPLAAAVISFGTGTFLLLACLPLSPRARSGLRKVVRAVQPKASEKDSGNSGSRRLRIWHCLGGICGAYLVLSQTLSATLLGVALFTVALVGGQVACGLLVDRLGLGPGGPQRVTANRIVGAGLAVLAVLVAVSVQLAEARISWLVIVPALAGLGMAWQQAVNARVKQAADSAIASSIVNFLIGSAALIVVLGVYSLSHQLPTSLPSDLWLYIGGPLGTLVIGTSALLVPSIGVLLLSMGVVSGQLLGALVLDLVVPAAGTHVHWSTVAGVCLAVVAVAIASANLPR